MSDKRISKSSADSIAKVVMQEQDAATAARIENKLLKERIAELEQREAELAAHVERLKSDCIDVLYDFAAVRDARGLILPMCDQGTPIVDAMEIAKAHPTTSLNALRRAENIKGARELANMIALPIAHVNANQYESIVNQRYPDKEQS